MCWSAGASGSMHSATNTTASSAPRRPIGTPGYIKWPLVTLAIGVISLLVIVPVAHVVYNAIAPGTEDYWHASETADELSTFGRTLPALEAGLSTYWTHLVDDADTPHANLLTLIVAPIAVALN